MFNQTQISAAMTMTGSPDEGDQKRGAVVLLELLGSTFFVDQEDEPWPDDPSRHLVPFSIHGERYEVLPIDMPVDTSEVNIAFDYGTLRFMLVKPVDPRKDVRSGKLAVEYMHHGKRVREFVSLRSMHHSTILNIVTRIVNLTPAAYKSAFDKLFDTMAKIGDEQVKLFR